jgi:alginate O-acetyltransferase complex protein AlgI
MAIGLGRIFGFHFLENFDYPYISKSITEFWRRWHISLGSWFRDYVYIPLGGNRKSNLVLIRNIFIVWLLTGLWHGASWNFVAWGLLFGILLVMEKLFLGKLIKKLPSIFQRAYVLFMVMISFIIFNASSMGEAIQNILGLFGIGIENLITKLFIILKFI